MKVTNKEDGLKDLNQRITTLANLPPDPEFKTLDPFSIKLALEVGEYLINQGVFTFYIYPTWDGGFMFEHFDSPDWLLDFEFHPEKRIVEFGALNKKDFDVCVWDEPYYSDARLPEKCFKLLKTFGVKIA